MKPKYTEQDFEDELILDDNFEALCERRILEEEIEREWKDIK